MSDIYSLYLNSDVDPYWKLPSIFLFSCAFHNDDCVTYIFIFINESIYSLVFMCLINELGKNKIFISNEIIRILQ